MAKETIVVRESKVSPLNSERAVRSGHTRQDYIKLYNAQKGGVRNMYARGEISEREYQKRMGEINRKLQNI